MGFVEGDDIFSGDVDVVVTDGFTGNVALKTMEGVAELIVDRMRQEFQRVAARAGLPACSPRPVLRRAAAGLDPRRYNGACMVGLDRDRGKKPRQRRPRRIRAGDRARRRSRRGAD